MPPLFVGAEGVILLADSESYAASRPIQAGLEVVTTLARAPVTQVYVACHTEDTVGAQFFLRLNGLAEAEVVTLAPADRRLSAWDAQIAALTRQRGKGPIDLMLTAFGEVFDHCLRTYQAAMLYGRRGSFDTVGTLPSWDELRERVADQRGAEVEDVDRGLTDLSRRAGW